MRVGSGTTSCSLEPFRSVITWTGTWDGVMGAAQPRRRPHHFPESPSRGLAGSSQLRTRPQRRSGIWKPPCPSLFPNTTPHSRTRGSCQKAGDTGEVVCPLCFSGMLASARHGEPGAPGGLPGARGVSPEGCKTIKGVQSWLCSALRQAALCFSLSLFSLGKCSRSFLFRGTEEGLNQGGLWGSGSA